MRLRSNSFTSKLRPSPNTLLENQLTNLTIDVSHFKKKIIVKYLIIFIASLSRKCIIKREIPSI